MSNTLFALLALWSVVGALIFLAVLDDKMGNRRITLYTLLSGPLIWVLASIITLVILIDTTIRRLRTALSRHQWWRRFNTWLDAA